jgi:UDP-glucose 4-epimerase
MLRGKRVFITGGAGFIGATAAGRLIEDNRILLYDSFDRDSLSTRGWRANPNLAVVRGNVLDDEGLTREMRAFEPTHVIHCAAIAGIKTVIKSPISTLEVNMIGTANALRAASAIAGLERFVSFSTSEIFGQQAFQSREDAVAVIGRVGVARWTYAVSKLTGEHLALAYHKERGLPAVIVRPFNVYGPGQIGEGALSIFIQRALKGEDIEIHGTGTQIRAWCYVDDMVRAVLLCLEHPDAPGESFNIGSARAVVTIYGLANTVIRVLDSPSKVRFTRKDYADVELRIPDVRKAHELLGFEAEVDLEEGIRMTADAIAAPSKSG